jgi:hypothetical protein
MESKFLIEEERRLNIIEQKYDESSLEDVMSIDAFDSSKMS